MDKITPPSNEDRVLFKYAALVSQSMGVMGASLVIFWGIGVVIDRWLNLHQIPVLIGVILGLITGFYYLYRVFDDLDIHSPKKEL